MAGAVSRTWRSSESASTACSMFRSSGSSTGSDMTLYRHEWRRDVYHKSKCNVCQIFTYLWFMRELCASPTHVFVPSFFLG
jgi:hypothetical protein